GQLLAAFDHGETRPQLRVGDLMTVGRLGRPSEVVPIGGGLAELAAADLVATVRAPVRLADGRAGFAVPQELLDGYGTLARRAARGIERGDRLAERPLLA